MKNREWTISLFFSVAFGLAASCLSFTTSPNPTIPVAPVAEQQAAPDPVHIRLAACEKLIAVSDDGTIVTRPFRKDEKAEVYTRVQPKTGEPRQLIVEHCLLFKKSDERTPTSSFKIMDI